MADIDLAGYINISHSNSYYFTNACNNDILIYPETSNQAIHLGITSNAQSAISINSNTMIINSTNLNINGATSLSNTLNVSGAATLSNGLTVYNRGTTSLCNAVNILGATTLSNTLITTGGTTTHSNDVNVYGATSIYNNGTGISIRPNIGGGSYTNLTSDGDSLIYFNSNNGANPTNNLVIAAHVDNISKKGIVISGSTGNVGIGKKNPTGTMNVSSDVNIYGNISAKKQFKDLC